MDGMHWMEGTRYTHIRMECTKIHIYIYHWMEGTKIHTHISVGNTPSTHIPLDGVDLDTHTYLRMVCN